MKGLMRFVEQGAGASIDGDTADWTVSSAAADPLVLTHVGGGTVTMPSVTTGTLTIDDLI